MISSEEALRILYGWNEKGTLLYGEFALVGETPFVTWMASVHALTGESLTLSAAFLLHDFELKDIELQIGENVPQDCKKRFKKVVDISASAITQNRPMMIT
jgi:hypothetical protein